MTTDAFTEAARAEAEERYPKDFLTTGGSAMQRREFLAGAEWARTHPAENGYGPMTTEKVREWTGARSAEQRAEKVRAWAVQQYPSGTPLDQERRMVAAETEAYLSGRTERDMSELAQAAKHAGPVDPPAAQEPSDTEVLESAARDLPVDCYDPRHMADWLRARARADRRDAGRAEG